MKMSNNLLLCKRINNIVKDNNFLCHSEPGECIVEPEMEGVDPTAHVRLR